MDIKNNDQKIMELKKQIEEKKGKLSKSQKFSPVTNCSLEIDGVRYNINTLNKEQIISLMIKINSYVLSASNLGLLGYYIVGGYVLTDWIADLKAKLEIIDRKDEETKLKAMESKLDQLLSDEKKTELELEEIMSMLK